jgi:hypothetical protein
VDTQRIVRGSEPQPPNFVHQGCSLQQVARPLLRFMHNDSIAERVWEQDAPVPRFGRRSYRIWPFGLKRQPTPVFRGFHVHPLGKHPRERFGRNSHAQGLIIFGIDCDRLRVPLKVRPAELPQRFTCRPVNMWSPSVQVPQCRLNVVALLCSKDTVLSSGTCDCSDFSCATCQDLADSVFRAETSECLTVCGSDLNISEPRHILPITGFD